MKNAGIIASAIATVVVLGAAWTWAPPTRSGAEEVCTEAVTRVMAQQAEREEGGGFALLIGAALAKPIGAAMVAAGHNRGHSYLVMSARCRLLDAEDLDDLRAQANR